MSQLSPQEEKELLIFIKDWLKLHGYSQKDLATELNISSSRSKEIANKIKEIHKKGGMFNVAKKLINIEQTWLNNEVNNEVKTQKEILKDDPYSQLDINYQVGIDELINQMEKDHKNK